MNMLHSIKLRFLSETLNSRLGLRDLSGAAWMQTYCLCLLLGWAFDIIPGSGWREGERFPLHMAPVSPLMLIVSMAWDWPLVKAGEKWLLWEGDILPRERKTQGGEPGNRSSQKAEGWITSPHLLLGISISLGTARPATSVPCLIREEGCKWP